MGFLRARTPLVIQKYKSEDRCRLTMRGGDGGSGVPDCSYQAFVSPSCKLLLTYNLRIGLAMNSENVGYCGSMSHRKKKTEFFIKSAHTLLQICFHVNLRFNTRLIMKRNGIESFLTWLPLPLCLSLSPEPREHQRRVLSLKYFQAC